MVSRFTGRDYSTLRQEIINFLRTRLPNGWDYTNLADPIVIFAESLARVGDQLHYTIDELRRECDIATAKRASSIYSYAMREGYKMMLPRAASGTISINTTKEQDGMLHLNLNQFDEIKVNPLGESLFVVNEEEIDTDLHAPVDETYLRSLGDYISETNGNVQKKAMTLYQSYYSDVYKKTQKVKVVLGTKGEYSFTYNDINSDSTVELPDPFIDRNLVRLSYANSKTGVVEGTNQPVYEKLSYVDDVISSGFNFKSFTLTPKFIGGAVILCIEFPTNFKDIFNNDNTTKFKFEYISIKNAKIEPLEEYQDSADVVSFPEGAITVVNGFETTEEITNSGQQYRVNFGDGIKGYAEYENALITRDNYKKFVQSYSALLTLNDYKHYIEAMTNSYCKVYDHGDMYKLPAVLPDNTTLFPRTIYIVTDSDYDGRESLWNDLKERSSRSDCIVLTPFGKDPYTIVIKADCYLVGTSITSISTQIEQALTLYYSGDLGEKIPKNSVINYLVHKASDKVVQLESCIVRDSTFGTVDTSFNNVNQLDNDQIDNLYNAFKSGNINYKSPLTDLSKNVDDPEGDYKYLLRGTVYEDDRTGQLYTPAEYESKKEEFSPEEMKDFIAHTAKKYYNKYPHIILNKQKVNEYSNFPEHFPLIYYVKKEGIEKEVTDYDELIQYQIGYGEIDSRAWDVNDSDIYEIKSEKVSDEETLYTAAIKESYKKHHYMTPVLNKVIVLIKAVNSNIFD